MSKETTEAFWKAWQAWVKSSDSDAKPPVYRLYYDDQGAPVRYTTENLPGPWIEVSTEVFAMSPANVRVVRGNLQIKDAISSVAKLTPSDMGTTCDPRDVCVIVDDTHEHQCWHKKWTS